MCIAIMCYIYVCVFCVYLCVCVVCIYVCMYLYVWCMCMFMCMYMCRCVCTRVCVCVCARVCAYFVVVVARFLQHRQQLCCLCGWWVHNSQRILSLPLINQNVLVFCLKIFQHRFIFRNMKSTEMKKTQTKSSKDEGLAGLNRSSRELCFIFFDRAQNLNFMKK